MLDFLRLLRAVAHEQETYDEADRGNLLVQLRTHNTTEDRARNRDRDELRREFTSGAETHIFDHPMMITILRDLYEIHDETVRRMGAIPGLSGLYFLLLVLPFSVDTCTPQASFPVCRACASQPIDFSLSGCRRPWTCPLPRS